MTPMNPTLRERYLADSVATASPAKLLLMLYDRLLLDLTRAEQALSGGDRAAAAAELFHAQEIVLELRTTLDTSAWDGAPGLASLYGFVLTELVAANVRGDAERVAGVRQVIEPLRDAWREAAAAEAANAAPARVA
ncbi:flagellar protein FliS [Micromonospora pattaloongensis]|uniref:Flagellar protein FliS n=1 Tax=Micromonospora pattaloongensis TaxID=405436 RepID=A0A1H3MWT9_9ACTN|nr:flagellar export chaperone FliS [Micromonospora pattaloongensis]SDY80930.1 flagellar protein FliS [Micromonospora pattaloongensis]